MTGLLVDENAPRCLVEALREAGYDVVWVREIRRGMNDEEIISLSIDESRVIMTFDKDFGELIYRSRRRVLGVILVRISDNEVSKRAVLDFLGKYSDTPAAMRYVDSTSLPNELDGTQDGSLPPGLCSVL